MGKVQITKQADTIIGQCTVPSLMHKGPPGLHGNNAYTFAFASLTNVQRPVPRTSIVTGKVYARIQTALHCRYIQPLGISA